MFFGTDCRPYFRFRLTFAENVPSSAEKSYIPSYPRQSIAVEG
jgi:hypothetical protein